MRGPSWVWRVEQQQATAAAAAAVAAAAAGAVAACELLLLSLLVYECRCTQYKDDEYSGVWTPQKPSPHGSPVLC